LKALIGSFFGFTQNVPETIVALLRRSMRENKKKTKE